MTAVLRVCFNIPAMGLLDFPSMIKAVIAPSRGEIRL
jgi:hypothetical protein